MQNLTVVVQNNSGSTTEVCLYRMLSNGNIWPIAWMAQSAHWNLGTTFKWTEQWQFVWAQTQALAGGTILQAGQAVNADPTASNAITLTYSAGSGFSFTGQKAGEQPGNYMIVADGTIPPQQVAAGLGMSGVVNAVIMAQPYFNLSFFPPTQIWIVAGDYKPGQILDPSTLGSAAQVVFPINTVSMTATLNADGSWSVASTPL
jgi:hypothetical protein